MHPAADRIVHAIRANEKITLYGDYDVDGITGTTMLCAHPQNRRRRRPLLHPPTASTKATASTPPDAVRQLIESGTKLLITIDCGCSAIAPITLARQLNVDVIVSDHHEFPGTGELPPANAIIHPRLPVEGQLPYPNPDLCGRAGVAFKLALGPSPRKSPAPKKSPTNIRALLMEFTALTALGTIADVVL